MHEEHLRRLQGDIHTKESFKYFLEQVVNEEAISRMRKREDTSHIADAIELINRAFEELDNQYGPTTPKPTGEIQNPSR